MPQTDCPECQGTGWKPIEAGGVRRVTRCDCREAERAERLLFTDKVRARLMERDGRKVEEFSVETTARTSAPTQVKETKETHTVKKLPVHTKGTLP